MIKVNLLATTPGAAPAREWLPRDQRAALAGLGLLAITAAGVGGWWYHLHREGTTIDAKVIASQAELTRLKAASKVVDQLTARKNELTERLSLIDRLRAAKREPVALLETVSQSLPDGLWLLEMKQTGPSVQIDGRATSLTAVTDFTERLQSSGYFKKPVEILTTATDAIDDIEVIKFSVKADAVSQQSLDPEPPAVPAPKRGGGAAARAAGARPGV
jgi:type IV pilus assembly protein PilN